MEDYGGSELPVWYRGLSCKISTLPLKSVYEKKWIGIEFKNCLPKIDALFDIVITRDICYVWNTGIRWMHLEIGSPVFSLPYVSCTKKVVGELKLLHSGQSGIIMVGLEQFPHKPLFLHSGARVCHIFLDWFFICFGKSKGNVTFILGIH